jgi:hypothetical protein
MHSYELPQSAACAHAWPIFTRSHARPPFPSGTSRQRVLAKYEQSSFVWHPEKQIVFPAMFLTHWFCSSLGDVPQSASAEQDSGVHQVPLQISWLSQSVVFEHG